MRSAIDCCDHYLGFDVAVRVFVGVFVFDPVLDAVGDFVPVFVPVLDFVAVFD